MYNNRFKTYQFKGRIHYRESEVSSQEPPQLCWVSKSKGGGRADFVWGERLEGPKPLKIFRFIFFCGYCLYAGWILAFRIRAPPPATPTELFSTLPLPPRVSHTPPRHPSPSRRSLVSICRSSSLNASLGVDGNCQIRNHGRCPECLTRSEIFPPFRVFPIALRFRVSEDSSVSFKLYQKVTTVVFYLSFPLSDVKDPCLHVFSTDAENQIQNSHRSAVVKGLECSSTMSLQGPRISVDWAAPKN